MGTEEAFMNIDLKALHRAIPRYTSYPTAPLWSSFSEENYKTILGELSGSISLYIHIPFCKSMCLYCGCSVILNRKPENEEKYVRYLLREIDLVSERIGKKMRVTQLHFGGGTPTQLTEPQFDRIMQKLHDTFDIDMQGEIAIEIDPRTVLDGTKLRHLHMLGFNRVSFGVQDTNPKVQEAVKRRQSYEMTLDTYLQARNLGFSGINIDLIYGLPYQTIETFKETIEKIIDLRPDRIALFSYAKVPWLKPHQKAIPDEALPSLDDKFAIYLQARDRLQKAGFQAIGMDHFALATDTLYTGYKERSLQRSFQGYTTSFADHFLGFGVTSIGYAAQSYVQNVKELSEYYQAIDERLLPVYRGRTLNHDDLIRRYVIFELMCRFCIDKKEFLQKFSLSFDEVFSEEKKRLDELQELFIETDEFFQVLPKGELFIRNIASSFDRYLHDPSLNHKFSKSI